MSVATMLKPLLTWIKNREKAKRARRIAEIRVAPDLAEMSDEELEMWIYGDLLK